MSLHRTEIIDLLAGHAMPDDELFSRARSVRTTVFGDGVVIRGVIEVTNRCRVNCTFCPMRRDNTEQNASFILDEVSVLAAVREIQKSGINVVFMQGGEIPQTTPLVERLTPQVLAIFNGGVEVLLNLGNKPYVEYARLREAGASSYIIKHETANADLYSKAKFETLDSRLNCINDLLSLGFKVGTGSIIGLPGQTLGDIADDILLAKALGAHMVSASPFVPAPNTPLSSFPAGSVDLTLRTMAVTRIMMPSALIPSVSALEATARGGQGVGLGAGANVMTVNFTPPQRQPAYLIYGTNRYIVRLQHVQTLLKENGLRMCQSLWAPTPTLTIP